MSTNFLGQIAWRSYLFEFLSIFIGLSLAFALQRWNENRYEQRAEQKTLLEIKNGLQLDLSDVRDNMGGHRVGIRSCDFFRQLARQDSLPNDSFRMAYYGLFRDYISVQNRTGYESLRSRGLEILKDDSLRYSIINMYDFQYEIIEKLEEQYSENQFNRNYFHSINDMLVAHLQFDEQGRVTGIDQPLPLSESDRKRLLSFLYRIQYNRETMLYYYTSTETLIKELIERIDDYTGQS